MRKDEYYPANPHFARSLINIVSFFGDPYQKQPVLKLFPSATSVGRQC